ncbi:MAG TPA: VTT domain-containing protein [Acidimicrobiales bacterium]|nr:VTT domain-containing protein [Acidimicrobiales bacterium]
MGTDAAAPTRPGRRRLYLLLAPVLVLTVLAYVGDIFFAGLVEEHPLWLIALNTRKRYLALVVPHTDAWSFFLVGTVRQVISDPLFYLLGRWYGDAGVRWLERKMGESGTMVRWLEQGFAKASWPMVAVVPNALICMLAGASSMPVWLFVLLNVGGTVAAMVILRAFGDVFSSPVESVTGFLSDYRWPIMAVSAVLVVLNVVLNRKRGTSDLESVRAMERELEEELEELEGDGPPTV